jgi:hypothetical protein
MKTHAASSPSVIGTVLVAALAAVQVVALAVLAERDFAPGERTAAGRATGLVMLPEVVVRAPRIGS